MTKSEEIKQALVNNDRRRKRGRRRVNVWMVIGVIVLIMLLLLWLTWADLLGDTDVAAYITGK